MSASDHLSPGQFSFAYRPISNGHAVAASTASGQHAGHLLWGDDGEIALVHVHEEYRRKGAASGMYAAGRAFADLHGVVEPHHSDDRSPEGDAWAHAVSPKSRIPKRLERP